MPYSPVHPDRSLRDFLLGMLEKAIMEQRPKASLESDLRHAARNAGKDHLIPTTARQCMKLMSFLKGDIQFYVACCEPCNKDDKACPVCGEPLFTARGRPRHVFFIRKLRPWIEHLMLIKDIKHVVDKYRERKSVDGIYADTLDGKYVQDLIQNGAHNFFIFVLYYSFRVLMALIRSLPPTH